MTKGEDGCGKREKEKHEGIARSSRAVIAVAKVGAASPFCR